VDFEDLAIFAGQLAALGLPARVSVGSVPENPGRNLQFDLAPLLADGGPGTGDSLVLLAADRLNDETLVRLRRLAGGAAIRAHAYGAFARRQTALGVRARLAYVLGHEPELCDTAPAEGDPRRPAPVFGVARPAAPQGGGPPRVLLVAPDMKDPLQAATLEAMALSRAHRVAVLTDSRAKQEWTAARGRGLPIYQLGEASPLALAARTDICVCFAPPGGSYRLHTLVANLLVAGGALLDGTPGHRLAGASDAFVPAPPGVVGLDDFLRAEILPNLARLREHTRASRAAAAVDAGKVVAFLGPAPRGSRPPASPGRSRRRSIVFMPTNGVGLGHAQRCGLIAAALAGPARPVFAAFPSCTRLVKSHGHDVMPLIGRSRAHARSHEHDLGNYLRLRALARDARTLVFDGGFVFDSVYRTLLETGIAGVWIRRGLWQPGQDNSVALDREKAFDRVIVPSEAFEELNAAYSRGPHLHTVGPIVQQVSLSAPARAELRDRLADRYERAFDRLVVSLLGAGVAAERGTQIQALSALFERRPDTLHLVLAWPTATLEPAWFGWRNTRVVRSHHAAVLTAAADLAITAAGYNSFHEALYNRVPSIFVPQTGAFMDDQRARARAAVDRGLAGIAEAHELMTLERLVSRQLDGEAEAVRARLAAADLPKPGTADAARLIEEVTDGSEAVERDRHADRSRGGR
jgi:hypothetical protein